MTLETTIREAVDSGLVELTLQTATGGWQAIAKKRGREGGPWGVGCDADPADAINIALAKLTIAEQKTGVFD